MLERASCIVNERERERDGKQNPRVRRTSALLCSPLPSLSRHFRRSAVFTPCFYTSHERYGIYTISVFDCCFENGGKKRNGPNQLARFIHFRPLPFLPSPQPRLSPSLLPSSHLPFSPCFAQSPDGWRLPARLHSPGGRLLSLRTL